MKISTGEEHTLRKLSSHLMHGCASHIDRRHETALLWCSGRGWVCFGHEADFG